MIATSRTFPVRSAASVLLLAALACTNPTGPATDPAGSALSHARVETPTPAASGAESLPFEGAIEGVLQVVPPFAPESDPRCNANFSGDPAAPGPSITLIDEGEIWFSHIGHGRLFAVSCVDPLSPTSSGDGFLEAPNGDRIDIAFENTVQPTGPDPQVTLIEGTQQITGGTGRFAGASGTQSCSFQVRFDTPLAGTIVGDCSGTISYESDGRQSR